VIFTIARLLPEILGLNGSSQNASLIATYLNHAGHEATIIDVHSPETAPLRVDAVCVGSGSASSLRPAASALIPLVRSLKLWREHGAWVVAMGTGWDLLGHSVTTPDGDILPGAGIFSSRADHRTARFSGEVAGVDYRGRPSVGYVNHVGEVDLGGGAPLVAIDAPESGYPRNEGCIAEGLFATRLGGPALALNPHWCGDIAEGLATAQGVALVRTAFHDRIENAAQKARVLIESRLGISRG